MKNGYKSFGKRIKLLILIIPDKLTFDVKKFKGFTEYIYRGNSIIAYNIIITMVLHLP